MLSAQKYVEDRRLYINNKHQEFYVVHGISRCKVRMCKSSVWVSGSQWTNIFHNSNRVENWPNFLIDSQVSIPIW